MKAALNVEIKRLKAVERDAAKAHQDAVAKREQAEALLAAFYPPLEVKAKPKAKSKAKSKAKRTDRTRLESQIEEVVGDAVVGVKAAQIATTLYGKYTSADYTAVYMRLDALVKQGKIYLRDRKYYPVVRHAEPAFDSNAWTRDTPVVN